MNQYQNYEDQISRPKTKSWSDKWLLPLSILISSLMITTAIIYSVGKNEIAKQKVNNTEQASTLKESSASVFGSGNVENIKPVNAEDHIRGNPEAPVKLVEFADTECPFCKSFHPTLKQLMQEYGESGQVAWVYRHMPIDEIHSKSRKEAQALECANELGGNEKFWEYTDRWYEVTPSNDNTDLSILPQIAEEIGLDRTQFELCIAGDMRGGKYADHIETDFQDAVRSGGMGTPYTIVIAPNGQKFPINGAQPYSVVKQIVDIALKLK